CGSRLTLERQSHGAGMTPARQCRSAVESCTGPDRWDVNELQSQSATSFKFKRRCPTRGGAYGRRLEDDVAGGGPQFTGGRGHRLAADEGLRKTAPKAGVSGEE